MFVIKSTKKYGNGVFAERKILKGEKIHLLRGERMTLGEMVRRVNRSRERIDDPFQIGRRTYIDLDNLSRSFNHSCNPNGGIKGNSQLFALRDINIGEEITYDYSATIAPTIWQMKCACGAPNCRKVLGDVRSIPTKQLRMYKYMGALQRYMKSLLVEIEEGSYVIPRYEVLALERLGDNKYIA